MKTAKLVKTVTEFSGKPTVPASTSPNVKLAILVVNATIKANAQHVYLTIIAAELKLAQPVNSKMELARNILNQQSVLKRVAKSENQPLVALLPPSAQLKELTISAKLLPTVSN